MSNQVNYCWVVSYCSNCKTIMQTFIIEVDSEPIYFDVMACPLCRIINLGGEFADKLATAIKERNIEE